MSDTLIDEYLNALSQEIKKWGGAFGRPIDTIYLGGGTPSLLGERIEPLLNTVRENFDVKSNAEITAEINPSLNSEVFLRSAVKAGVNRLSVGVQSGNEDELKILGRGHTLNQAADTVNTARKLGFNNISLDLMLALPNSSIKTLDNSISFLLSLNPEHISAYLLKIEQGTKFYAEREKLNLPDDEGQEEQYLYMCERLKNAGFMHYEISNFAKTGYESRHNLKYWNCEEYLGIGPSAHSFLNGERFYYPKDLRAFLKNPATESDGVGGETEERIMLALRLKEGVDFSQKTSLHPYLLQLERSGFGIFNSGRFSLTERGMLVSNTIITEILERLL